MSFEEFLNSAWNEHATATEGVAARLHDFNVTAQEQIPQLASIISHVFGEHLGRWKKV